MPERRKNWKPFVPDPTRVTPVVHLKGRVLPDQHPPGVTNRFQDLHKRRENAQKMIGCTVALVASCFACGGSAYILYASNMAK